MAGDLKENFNELCRLCAANINDMKRVNIFEADGIAKKLKAKIEICLPIQVSESDDLPKIICLDCDYKLELCSAFRQKAIDTQSLLITLREKQNVPIKQHNPNITNTVANEQMTVNLSIPNDFSVPDDVSIKFETLDVTDPHITNHELDSIEHLSQGMELNAKSQLYPASTEQLMSGQFEEVFIQESQTAKPSETFTIKVENEVNLTDEDTIIQCQYNTQYKSENSNNHNFNVQNNSVAESSSVKSDDSGFVYKDLKILENLLKTYNSPICQTQVENDTSANYSKQNTNFDKQSNLLKVIPDCIVVDDYEEKIDDNKRDGKSRVAKPKVCQVCGKSYRTNYKLTQHMRTHTGERPFKCGLCESAFSSKTGLVRHEIKHTGHYDYTCPTCGKGFQYRKHLELHQTLHSNMKPHLCTTCGKTFLTKQALNVHTDRHLGIKPYICDVCGKGYVTKEMCKSHQRVHSGIINRQYPCKICKKLFVSKSYLRIHLKMHAGDKSFACEDCGKGFFTRFDLRLHSTVHTGEKSFVCELCGKAFSRRDAFKCHQRLHTGERPYRCDVCEKRFTQASSLTIHKRIHTGERPFKCKVCGKAFISRSTMMLHYNKKHVS